MYPIILFDLDDTLLDFKRAELTSLLHIHSNFYSNFDLAYFIDSFKEINTTLWGRVGNPRNSFQPKDLRLLRFTLLNKKLQTNNDINEVGHAYEKKHAQSAPWLPGAKAAIELLHAKGHILGIITNGLSQVQQEKCALHNLQQWFNTIVISDEIGISKPQPQIFDITLTQLSQKLGYTVSSTTTPILMVGDSLASDGQGAKNANLSFCYIEAEKKENSHKDVPIHHHLKSVAELPVSLGY